MNRFIQHLHCFRSTYFLNRLALTQTLTLILSLSIPLPHPLGWSFILPILPDLNPSWLSLKSTFDLLDLSYSSHLPFGPFILWFLLFMNFKEIRFCFHNPNLTLVRFQVLHHPSWSPRTRTFTAFCVLFRPLPSSYLVWHNHTCPC